LQGLHYQYCQTDKGEKMRALSVFAGGGPDTAGIVPPVRRASTVEQWRLPDEWLCGRMHINTPVGEPPSLFFERDLPQSEALDKFIPAR
jgi:hypothetical protein